jgi:hypothetical protein
MVRSIARRRRVSTPIKPSNIETRSEPEGEADMSQKCKNCGSYNQEKCRECNGNGQKNYGGFSSQKCARCGGSGWVCSKCGRGSGQ